MSKRFLFTGTGRCGTGYISQLSTALGHPCAHEGIFHPSLIKEGIAPHTFAVSHISESSWLALPFLDQLPDDVEVIHVYRDPAKVWESLVRIRFFEEGHAGHKPYLDIAYKECPNLARREHPGEKATCWMQHVYRKLKDCRRIKVDDDPVPQLLELFGMPKTARNKRRGMMVPTNYNSRRRIPMPDWYCETPEVSIDG